MDKRVIIKNFWPPYWNNNTPELTEDQLGWSECHKFDARSDDTKTIFFLFIDHLGWDLSFYFPETDKFYYIEVIFNKIYCRDDNPNWDGKFIYDRSDVYEPPLEENPIFTFEKTQDVWDNFKIGNWDMKYILEHSVLWLSH